MSKKAKDQRAEGLVNTMSCARWLVQQFEVLDCASIARIFQKAVDDADSWIQTMAMGGALPKESADPIRAREAELIHNMLVKYASINDPSTRNALLSNMISSLDDEAKDRKPRGKRYATRY